MRPSLIQAHHSHPDLTVPDPYRLFFPLGILMGLLGVSVWPVLALGWITYPNPLWHIDILLQGFLFAFILGFLLTALPRFSKTWPITKFELGFFLTIYVTGNFSTLLGSLAWGRIAFWGNLTFLLIFALRRFFHRKANPPPEFVFVGAGLLLGWLAAWIRSDAYLPFTFGFSEMVGRRLITEGMVLMLVLGVSGKLTPMFFGFSKGNPLVQLGKISEIMPKLKFFGITVLVLVGSFFLEYISGLTKLSLCIRALAASLIFFKILKIHQKPLEKGKLISVLRWSNWAVLTALWGIAIWPQYRVEMLHILFIGGFGTMILGIATRVIVSHGNYPSEIEKKSRSLGFAGMIFFVALILRVASPFTGKYYFSMLGLAGAFWILGLILWGSFFIPRTFKKNKP